MSMDPHPAFRERRHTSLAGTADAPSIWDTPTPEPDLGRFPAPSRPIDTSEEAADSLTPERLRKLRKQVLLWFLTRESNGGTADELAEEFGTPHHTTSPRISELTHLGYLQHDGRKRPTRTGRNARVYQITLKGIDATRGAP